MSDHSEAILRFWFGEPGTNTQRNVERWFSVDDAFDAKIRDEFGGDLERAGRGELDAWSDEDARSALALIVVLDQFSRHVFRGTREAFDNDPRALSVCEKGIAQGIDRKLSLVERHVFQMPMMHAEDRRAQDLSVDLFAQLMEEAKAASAPSAVQKTLEIAHDYAVRHARVVERFGRFPHRNAILGRKSTPEELDFLKEAGSNF